MKRAIILFSLLALAACVPPAATAAAAAARPMAECPPGARVFTVYFGWNRSWVGPSGMAVLQQAAAVYSAGGVVTVRVTGYTDTSGSVGYNQRLSDAAGADTSPMSSSTWACRGGDGDRRPLARTISPCQRRTVFASRTTAASRSSSSPAPETARATTWPPRPSPRK